MKCTKKPKKAVNLKSYVNSALRHARVAWLASILGLSVAHAQDEGFVVDKIIAKVDNYIVLKSELDRAYQDYVTNGGTPSEQARCQYMALLIRNKLMMAKAEIDSVVVLDVEVDMNTQNRIDMILAQSGNTPEQLETIYGKSMEQIKSELREQIREQMVVREMEKTITKDLAVTPAEVRRFFNNISKDSLPYFSAEVEVAQIVKVAEVSQAQKEATRNQLIDLRNQLLGGADFTELAKKYSDDPTASYNGGDLGWVGRGQLVPEFEAMAFKLKPDEFSMPVETQYGYHLIQLLERRGNEYHARHILVSPTPSQDDLTRASNFLDSLRTRIQGDSTTFEKAAKEYSDDPGTKGQGGYFMDADGGTRLPVEDLDPVVYFKIDSMNLGDVSKPIVYRTDDQKNAVRILYYKSRVSPHQASLEQDWHRIQSATMNEKRNRVLQKWFEKARHDVFINIDPEYDYCGILDE
ncbi:MAG: peptidylprolyl isomerase [Bacteroidia bacterium]|nr:peptidylprolyl isomerase [Bacteroidia bacterium]